MAEIYKTNDGRLFDSKDQAQTHANNLAIDNEKHEAHKRAWWQELLDYEKKITDCYNKGDLNGVINNYSAFKIKLNEGYGSHHDKFIHLYNMNQIAEINRDKDYIKAFAVSGWVWGGETSNDQNESKYYKTLFEIGKKIWEQKHGRSMTEDIFDKSNAGSMESRIVKWFNNESLIKWECGDGSTRTREDEAWDLVPKWEEATGRKMTTEDQIRIYGKPFPKKNSSKKGGFLSGLFGKK